MRAACAIVIGCVFFLPGCASKKTEAQLLTVDRTEIEAESDVVIHKECISPDALAAEFKKDAAAASAKYFDLNATMYDRPLLTVRGKYKTKGIDHRITTDSDIDVVLRGVTQGTGNLVEGEGRVVEYKGKQIVIWCGRVKLFSDPTP